MHNECIQGDGRDTYVVLDTFLGDGTRDHPKGRESQGDGLPIVVVAVTRHQGEQ